MQQNSAEFKILTAQHIFALSNLKCRQFPVCLQRKLNSATIWVCARTRIYAPPELKLNTSYKYMSTLYTDRKKVDSIRMESQWPSHNQNEFQIQDTT